MHWKFLISQGFSFDCMQTTTTKHRKGGKEHSSSFSEWRTVKLKQLFRIRYKWKKQTTHRKRKGLQNMQIDSCHFLDTLWTQGCENQHCYSKTMMLQESWPHTSALQRHRFETAPLKVSNSTSTLGSCTRGSDWLRRADTDMRKTNLFLIFRRMFDLFLVTWPLAYIWTRDFLLGLWQLLVRLTNSKISLYTLIKNWSPQHKRS